MYCFFFYFVRTLNFLKPKIASIIQNNNFATPWTLACRVGRNVQYVDGDEAATQYTRHDTPVATACDIVVILEITNNYGGRGRAKENSGGYILYRKRKFWYRHVRSITRFSEVPEQNFKAPCEWSCV